MASAWEGVGDLNPSLVEQILHWWREQGEDFGAHDGPPEGRPIPVLVPVINSLSAEN